MNVVQAVDPRRALTVLCGVFFSAGFAMAAIGPVLPALSTRTGASLAELGGLMMAIFAGSFGAQFVAGYASDRFGRRLVLTHGLALLGLCVTIISLAPSLIIVLATGVFYGLGYGAFSLSGNVLASELAPERRASAVNLVNMAFGVGAVVGPLAVSILIERTGRALPALWIGTALLAASAILAFTTLPPRVGPVTPRARPGARGGATLRDPMLLAIGLFLLLYVGSEMSAGAWTSVYLQRSAGLDAAKGAAATSLFWAMLTLGRVAATVVGMRIAAEHLLTAAVGVACAGAALLWAGHGSATASVVALAILGFGYGPCYPTGVALITSRFPHAAGAATSQMGLLAASGGLLLPWLHGLVLEYRSTAESATFTLVIGIAMIAGWLVTRRAARRPPAHA